MGEASLVEMVFSQVKMALPHVWRKSDPVSKLHGIIGTASHFNYTLAAAAFHRESSLHSCR